MSNTLQLGPLKIIGLAIRTTNHNNQAAQDIGNLWQQLYAGQWLEKIPNPVGMEVYSIYTDYVSNYTDAYTALIGLQVSSLEQIPEGLVGREFPANQFIRFTARGSMPQAMVDTWVVIWNQDAELHRQYAYDFEVYAPKSQQGADSEVDIFISVTNA
jgi:predicted transcriptional regulator YdeE